MGDRVRIGELLAGVGAIGLALLLGLADWFYAKGSISVFSYSVTAGAGRLGWFAWLLVLASAVAGLILIVRVLTAPTTERPMLQAAIVYAISLFTLIVVVIRVLLFLPDISTAQARAQLIGIDLDVGLTTAGWLGILALTLLMVGSWITLNDERDKSAAARARAAALLAEMTVRPAPPATGTPDTESAVVAEDAVGTDPVDAPSAPASDTPGESA